VKALDQTGVACGRTRASSSSTGHGSPDQGRSSGRSAQFAIAPPYTNFGRAVASLVPRAIVLDGETVHLEPTISAFSTAERALIRTFNPITACVGHRLQASRVDLSQSWLLIREHPLLEKLNLIDNLLRLGLPPGQLLFVPKPDLAAHRHFVMATLRGLGVTVIDQVADERGNLSPPLKTILDRCASRLIVFDDGGDLIAQACGWGHDIVCIESTAKGVRKLRAEHPEIRFVDVSNTPIKQRASGAIAFSCVCALRRLLPHDRIVGERIVVGGFGAIGAPLARQLRAAGAYPVVAELSPDKAREARSQGFVTSMTISLAVQQHRPRLYMGCVGQPSITESDLVHFADDAVLGSVSSQDLRQVRQSLQRYLRAPAASRGGTEYVLPDPPHRVTILADGNAINLHDGEGVAEAEFDEVIALHLATIAICGTHELAAVAGVASDIVADVHAASTEVRI